MYFLLYNYIFLTPAKKSVHKHIFFKCIIFILKVIFSNIIIFVLFTFTAIIYTERFVFHFDQERVHAQEDPPSSNMGAIAITPI